MVNIEYIYAQFLKSEWNEFSEYVIEIFFIRRGLNTKFKNIFGFFNVLDQKYFSQIKSNPKNLRKIYWQYPKLIQIENKNKNKTNI